MWSAAPKIRRDDKGKQQEFIEKKKERAQPGRFVQERNQTGGGVVLKMTMDSVMLIISS